MITLKACCWNASNSLQRNSGCSFHNIEKSPTVPSWNDFYFEVRTYLEGWLTELKIDTFEQLKDLIITDKIKKKCPPDYRERFIDDWSGMISPSELSS
ncbi:hypothetical protein AVEN_105288-1 [Araneus ventricosus]|uniref:Uncharacterized protein n=1 Tax=Araneus ventricosus TaxID=182803 RepID=A0A4Y2PVZ3_ARAVE|nr:hypothetical protein AVEN_105288-1 [Araneus ventricosus]